MTNCKREDSAARADRHRKDLCRSDATVLARFLITTLPLLRGHREYQSWHRPFARRQVHRGCP